MWCTHVTGCPCLCAGTNNTWKIRSPSGQLTLLKVLYVMLPACAGSLINITTACLCSGAAGAVGDYDFGWYEYLLRYSGGIGGLGRGRCHWAQARAQHGVCVCVLVRVMCIFICIYVYMCICMCVYVCIHVYV